MQNKKQDALTPAALDTAIIRAAMQNAMKTPLERTASASVFSVPAGWETDALKAEGAMAKAHNSDELEQLVRDGHKTIFVPKESFLLASMIAQQLDALYADVAVFLEEK